MNRSQVRSGFNSAAAVMAAVSVPLRVALVFEDGPDPVVTPRLLAVLATAGVRANFSYLGRQVEAHPALARAAVAAGHEINNHSYSHPHLVELEDAAVVRELGRTSLAIQWATGRRPAWFWAPYLETDERVERLAGLTTKLIHFPCRRHRCIAAGDWTFGTAATRSQSNAVTGVTDGSIILLDERRAETLAALPGILAALRRQNVAFLTLTELAAAPNRVGRRRCRPDLCPTLTAVSCCAP